MCNGNLCREQTTPLGNWHDEAEVAIREIIDAWRKRKETGQHASTMPSRSREKGMHACARTTRQWNALVTRTGQ